MGTYPVTNIKMARTYFRCQIIFAVSISTPRCRHKEKGNHVPVSKYDVINHGDVDWEAAVKVDKRQVHRYVHESGHDEFIHIHPLISRKRMTQLLGVHELWEQHLEFLCLQAHLASGAPSSLTCNPDLHTTSRTANPGSAGTRNPLRQQQPTISGNHSRRYRLHRILIAAGGVTTIQ